MTSSTYPTRHWWLVKLARKFTPGSLPNRFFYRAYDYAAWYLR